MNDEIATMELNSFKCFKQHFHEMVRGYGLVEVKIPVFKVLGTGDVIAELPKVRE